MDEMLSNLISANINVTVFYFSIVVFLSIIPIVLVLVKPNRFLSRARSYIFLFGVVIMGIIAITPIMMPTINLLKDYQHKILYVQEGVVEDRYIRKEHYFIEIDNKQFIVPTAIEGVKEGQYCSIEYFKYSKYIYQLEIKKYNDSGVK